MKTYKIISIFLLTVLILELFPAPVKAWTYYQKLNNSYINLEQSPLSSAIGTPGDLRLSANQKEGSGNYIVEKGLFPADVVHPCDSVSEFAGMRLMCYKNTTPPAPAGPLQTALFTEKMFSGKLNTDGLEIRRNTTGSTRQNQKGYTEYYYPQGFVATSTHQFKFDFIILDEVGVKIKLEKASGGVKYTLTPSYKGEIYGLEMATTEKDSRSYRDRTKITEGINYLFKFANLKINQSDINNWVNNNSKIITPSSKVLIADVKVHTSRSCSGVPGVYETCDNWTYVDGSALAADGRLGEMHTGTNNPSTSGLLSGAIDAAKNVWEGAKTGDFGKIAVIAAVIVGGYYLYSYIAGSGTTAGATGTGTVLGTTKGGLIATEVMTAEGPVIIFSAPAGAGTGMGSFGPIYEGVPLIISSERPPQLTDPKFANEIISTANAQQNQNTLIKNIILGTKEADDILGVDTKKMANDLLDQTASKFREVALSSGAPFGTVESLGGDWGWTKRTLSGGGETTGSNPACRDRLDNDSDGKIDYPADPGCSSLTDNDESDSGGSGSGPLPPGAIRLNATLDGNPWTGAVGLNTEEPYVNENGKECYGIGKVLYSRSSKVGCSYENYSYSAPQDFLPPLPLGDYKITGVASGGPAGAVYKGVRQSNPQTLNSGNNLTFTLEFKTPPPIITYFSASGGELPYGYNSRSIGLSWGSSNADSCKGSWSSDTKPTSGSDVVSDKPRGNYSFGLTCVGIGGSISKSAETGIVSVPAQNPNKLFSGNPNPVIPPDSSTLSWDIDHTSSCSIDQGIGSVCDSGKGLDYCKGFKEVRPTQDTTYTLTCQGLDGSRDFQTTVKIKTPGTIIYKEVAP